MASRKNTTRRTTTSSRKPRKATAARAPKDDRVTAYAKAVVAGKVIAGPHVRNACRRHLQDLKKAAARGLTWNKMTAEEALRPNAKKPLDRVFGFFSEVLRLAGGQFEGRPFELEPAQAFIVGSLFGWRRKDGTRRFRRAYIEQGKGAGKSPLAAGIGMYGLVADGEARAEVYAAASKKDQAMVLFRDAVAMVEQSPKLRSRITKSGGNPVWNLAQMETASFFRPISSDDGQSGPRPHIALCDEIHEHRNGTVIEMLERGFKSRRQPLLVMITNSGSDRNSVCWQEHQHGTRVAAGTMTPDDEFTYVGEVIDDETFAYVCALDKDDDPLEDPSCWKKANPLLGVTLTEDYLAGVVRQAKAIPGKLNGILRLHFCVWTDAETAWMGRPALEAVLADFDPLEHAGKRLFGGLDLSGSQDLTAAAFCVETGTVSVPRGTEMVELPTYDAWVEAWTPKDTLVERSLRDQAPYEVWVKGGWLNAVEGRNIRLDFVAARLAEISVDYQMELLAYDRYAYRKLEMELDALGLTFPQAEHPQGGVRRAKPTEQQVEEARMRSEEPPQGLWMPGSVLALETLILERRIRLRRSPVLISAVMSAALERDAFDNRWFSKRRAVNRIDPLVALAMAVGAATANAGGAPQSVYEHRDILML